MLLVEAAKRGDLTTCRALITSNVFDVNSCDEWDKKTALHVASNMGNIALMQLLITECDADVNRQDKFGQTSLHLASYNRKVDAVRLLLMCGANATQIDRWGRTALYFATEMGDVDICKLLLGNSQNESLGEMLGLASLWGKQQVVELFVELRFGADITRSMVKHCPHTHTQRYLSSWMLATQMWALQSSKLRGRCAVRRLPKEMLWLVAKTLTQD